MKVGAAPQGKLPDRAGNLEEGTMTVEERRLRAELICLKARYDCYAFAPEIYRVVKELETAIAWLAFRRMAQ